MATMNLDRSLMQPSIRAIQGA